MAFLVFDDTLGEPPDITKLIPPQPQLVPYTPDPDPLTDSPLENRAKEMARQLERVAQALNTHIIAAGDMMRQVRACAKALDEASRMPNGPTQTLALAPSIKSIQTRASREARADWTAVASVDLTPEDQARFWRKVIKTPEHWIWRGGIDRNTNRGQFRVGGRLLYAHRVAYTLHTGNPLDGENLRNVCGEPLCVQWNHQRPGSIGAELRAPKRTLADEEHERELLEAASRRYDEHVASSQSTEAIRNIDTTPYAKNRYGHKKVCRKGHFLTVQPSGRTTCRQCDLDRKKRYDERHTLVNQREQFVKQTRAELADGLDREFTDTLLAQILPADAPAPDPAPAPPTIDEPSTSLEQDFDELFVRGPAQISEPPAPRYAGRLDVPYATNMPLVEREPEKPVKVTTNPDTGEEERWYALTAPATSEPEPDASVGDKLSNLRMLRPTKNPEGAPDA